MDISNWDYLITPLWLVLLGFDIYALVFHTHYYFERLQCHREPHAGALFIYLFYLYHMIEYFTNLMIFCYDFCHFCYDFPSAVHREFEVAKSRSFRDRPAHVLLPFVARHPIRTHGVPHGSHAHRPLTKRAEPGVHFLYRRWRERR